MDLTRLTASKLAALYWVYSELNDNGGMNSVYSHGIALCGIAEFNTLLDTVGGMLVDLS